MTRADRLRSFIAACEGQLHLGFNERGEPIDIEETNKLLREARIRLAAEELTDRDYPTAMH